MKLEKYCFIARKHNIRKLIVKCIDI